MGLLDALFQNGGGSGGGLLDFLRSNAANQQQPSGLPSDQALYGQPIFSQAMPQQSAQPSPLDSAQWPAGPLSAPAQANAQMPPQQPPPVQGQPMQSSQGPGAGPALMAGAQGVGNHLMAGMQSFAQSGGVIPAIANGLSGLITGQRNDPAGVAAQQLAQQRNFVATGLRKRGVSEEDIAGALSNSEYLKKVMENSVKEKDAPTGFEANPTGGLRPITGGPADPAYLRLKAIKEQDPNAVHVLGKDGELYKVDAKGNPTIVHKNQSSVDANLDDDTTKAMAAQYLAGDKSVKQNLGRGAQGSANLVKLSTEIYKQANEQGLDGKAIVNNFNEQAGALAGQRAVGTRAANISLAANEANNMIPIALAASDKLPRTQYMPWNQMVQSVQKGSSSPELASFVAATNSLVNSYVRAVSPSGVPTDSMREHAYSMLNAAQGPEAYKAVVATMQKEMGAALQAPAQVRKELRSGIAEAPRESQGESGDAIYAQAKAAIAKGAPRDKVLERLRQNGVDASGL